MSITKISEYLKTHERLLIVVLAAMLITGGYRRVLGYLEHRDELAARQSQIALQAQQRVNEQLAEETQKTVKSYQDLVKQLDGRFKDLQVSQNNRDAETKTQQAKDRILPPTEVASRWASLVELPVAQIQPTDSGYTVSPGVAKETIFQLDSIPGLTEDLKDEKQIVSLKDQQITGQDTVNVALTAQLKGMSDEIIKQNKACKDEVSLVKAQARKSKIKWFFIGAAFGALARNLAGL